VRVPGRHANGFHGSAHTRATATATATARARVRATATARATAAARARLGTGRGRGHGQGRGRGHGQGGRRSRRACVKTAEHAACRPGTRTLAGWDGMRWVDARAMGVRWVDAGVRSPSPRGRRFRTPNRLCPKMLRGQIPGCSSAARSSTRSRCAARRAVRRGCRVGSVR
jgi:hypothetical protein